MKKILGSWGLVFLLGFVIFGMVGLSTWVHAGSANAHPGMSCNPEPGHGTPGCHKEAATTTTAKPKPTTTTTKPKPTTTTTKAKTTTTKASSGTTKPSTVTTKASTGTTEPSSTTTATTAVDNVTTVDTGATDTATSSTEATGDTTASDTSSTEATTSSTTPTTAAPAGSDSGPPPLLIATKGYLDQNNCLSCHGNPSLSKPGPNGTTISLYVNTADLPEAAHRFQDCTDCHGSDPHASQSPLTKASEAQLCGSCHRYQYSQYLNSIHGTQANGKGPAATCADCHSADSNPHTVVQVLDPSASTYPKNVAQTCAKCHNDPTLMSQYGIVEKVYETYMSSYHGKAMVLTSDKAAIQELNVATCVSCHGDHNIKAVNDPTSTVAGMDNLIKTCQGCHPGAGAQFVSSFMGHKAASPNNDPEAYWGGKTFFVFSRAMLAGGVLIVASSLGLRGVPRITRKLKRRNKKEG